MNKFMCSFLIFISFLFVSITFFVPSEKSSKDYFVYDVVEPTGKDSEFTTITDFKRSDNTLVATQKIAKRKIVRTESINTNVSFERFCVQRNDLLCLISIGQIVEKGELIASDGASKIFCPKKGRFIYDKEGKMVFENIEDYNICFPYVFSDEYNLDKISFEYLLEREKEKKNLVINSIEYDKTSGTYLFKLSGMLINEYVLSGSRISIFMNIEKSESETCLNLDYLFYDQNSNYYFVKQTFYDRNNNMIFCKKKVNVLNVIDDYVIVDDDLIGILVCNYEY